MGISKIEDSDQKNWHYTDLQVSMLSRFQNVLSPTLDARGPFTYYVTRLGGEGGGVVTVCNVGEGGVRTFVT